MSSHSALTISKLGVACGSKSKARRGVDTVPATRAGASNCQVILDTWAYRLSWCLQPSRKRAGRVHGKASFSSQQAWPA